MSRACPGHLRSSCVSGPVPGPDAEGTEHLYEGDERDRGGEIQACELELAKALSQEDLPDLVRFTVQSPCQGQMPWAIGPIRADKTFTHAVPTAPAEGV